MASGSGEVSLTTPAVEKPVVVRVKRKTFQSPLEGFWLEINERPLKKPLLDFAKLSVSESSSSSTSEGLKTKKVFVQHVETSTDSKATVDIVQSFLSNSTEVVEDKGKNEERRHAFKKDNLQARQDQRLSKSIVNQEIVVCLSCYKISPPEKLLIIPRQVQRNFSWVPNCDGFVRALRYLVKCLTSEMLSWLITRQTNIGLINNELQTGKIIQYGESVMVVWLGKPASAKSARFEQIWRSRKGTTRERPDEDVHEKYQFYDVLRIDNEERSSAMDMEEMSLEDKKLLSSYLPLLEEFIPMAAAELESDIRGYMAQQDADEYVYDYYTVNDDMKVDSEDASNPFPLVQVDDMDFYDVPDESEYDSQDSNAEDNPQNDYPDEVSEDGEDESETTEESEMSLNWMFAFQLVNRHVNQHSVVEQLAFEKLNVNFVWRFVSGIITFDFSQSSVDVVLVMNECS
ncbi:hypothetical protein ACFE04_014367 [Oxalis oulophora]